MGGNPQVSSVAPTALSTLLSTEVDCLDSLNVLGGCCLVARFLNVELWEELSGKKGGKSGFLVPSSLSAGSTLAGCFS